MSSCFLASTDTEQQAVAGGGGPSSTVPTLVEANPQPKMGSKWVVEKSKGEGLYFLSPSAFSPNALITTMKMTMKMTMMRMQHLS
jgi:hypothetical protein